MQIETKFAIRDRVKIKELEWHGYVISIWITLRGEEYQVRYCQNGKRELEYFFAEELEAAAS